MSTFQFGDVVVPANDDEAEVYGAEPATVMASPNTDGFMRISRAHSVFPVVARRWRRAEKTSESDSPGLAAPDGTHEHPAASETPQDAREVEQRERAVEIRSALLDSMHAGSIDPGQTYGEIADRLAGHLSPIVEDMIAPYDREHAALVAERDRLRVGIEALAHGFEHGIPEGPAAIHFCPEGCGDLWESEATCRHEPGYRGAARDLRALLATPAADARTTEETS